MTRIADRLIERELREMAVSPKQQEVIDKMRKLGASLYTIQASYGRNASRATNYDMRWFSSSTGLGLSQKVPTRLVSELLKNKALDFVQADDGHGSWKSAFIPAGDDPEDYGIKVWDK